MSKTRFVAKGFTPDDPAVSPEVADKELTFAVLGALEMVVNDMAVEGWDAPPFSGPLYLRGRTPVGQMKGWAGAVLEWHPLPVLTETLMRHERQHHVLLYLAERYQELTVDLLPDDLVAWVLVNEAWTLAFNPENEEEVAAARAVAEERQMHVHPNRVELKQAIAVDLNGTVYFVKKERGQKVTYQAGPAGSPHAIGGDIPNAMEYLMLSLQGKQLPDWQEWWSTNRNYESRLKEDG